MKPKAVYVLKRGYLLRDLVFPELSLAKRFVKHRYPFVKKWVKAEADGAGWPLDGWPIYHGLTDLADGHRAVIERVEFNPDW